MSWALFTSANTIVNKCGKMKREYESKKARKQTCFAKTK